MGNSLWLQACNVAESRSVIELHRANNIAGSTAVVVFALAAAFSGTWYALWLRVLLWRRQGAEVVGDRIWKDLGQFCVAMCAGCIAGLVAFSAHMHWYASFRDSKGQGVSRRQYYELEASALKNLVAFSLFYPVQLACIVFAMNLLLRRVSDHASHSYYNQARDYETGRLTDDGRYDWRDCVGQYKLFNFVRSMNTVVMLLCVFNAVARVVVAAFRVEAAAAYDAAAAACDGQGQDTVASLQIHADYVRISESNISKSTAVSRVLEASILVIMAAGFLLFFPACIVMFRRVERRLRAIMQEMGLRSDLGNVFLPFEFSPQAAVVPQADTSLSVERVQVEMPVVEARSFLHRIKTDAAAQRRRFVACIVIVPLALVVQAIMAVVIAVRAFAFAESEVDASCGKCESCQNIISLIKVWYDGTPELFALVSSLCSTLPLVFGLWLMMTKDDRDIMLHPRRYLPDEIARRPVADEASANLKVQRQRMGIELK